MVEHAMISSTGTIVRVLSDLRDSIVKQVVSLYLIYI